MEATLTQNCALYYMQHRTSTNRTALFKKFRAAARRQAPVVHLRLTHDERTRHLALYRDNGR